MIKLPTSEMNLIRCAGRATVFVGVVNRTRMAVSFAAAHGINWRQLEGRVGVVQEIVLPVGSSNVESTLQVNVAEPGSRTRKTALKKRLSPLSDMTNVGRRGVNTITALIAPGVT